VISQRAPVFFNIWKSVTGDGIAQAMACPSIAKSDDVPKFIRGHSIAERRRIPNAK
jgi:hypothetical protein